MTATRIDSPRPAPAIPLRRAQQSSRSRLESSPEELALRAQRGSMPAFAELVDRFEARLFNFLLRRVSCAADAEDLTQEAFLRAWQRIATYSPKWRFSTWLFTIALRLAVSQSRKRAGPAQLGGAHSREDPAIPPPDLQGTLEEAEDRSMIWALVGQTLGPEQQSALWLRYVEGMAVKDIATVLGRTQVSVRVMLFRARAVLAERLGREQPAILESKPVPGVQSVSNRGVPC